jgi:murein DD-endopeptidase MepM/ murein hydrolase activator NlpD
MGASMLGLGGTGGGSNALLEEIFVEPIPRLTLPEPGTYLNLTIRRGDSLDRLFRKNGLSIGDLARIMKLDESRQHLRMIRPGDELKVKHDNGTVLALSRELDIVRMLEVDRAGDEFSATVYDRPLETRRVSANGTINSSLFEAAADAGVSDRTIMNLAGIFAWDIDFVLDIRQGDSFSVVYEEKWRDDERLAEGKIVAAEFVNRGESFRALRYVDPDGRPDYFTPEGRSVRKAFMRAPVEFSRISSNFNPRRRHPILNTIRAHRGVDYAAPSGTPVRAAGDGKVIFRGQKSGYGNAVILQHGGNITTLYGHLSKFSRSAGMNKRVRQGDTIGFVGMTGLATAPHLHYEYRTAGVHRNPRTVELPEADPINPGLKADFLAQTAPLVQLLDGNQPMLADTSLAD